MPVIVPKAKVPGIEGFPVDHYSYSMWGKFLTNPVLARIIYLNHDSIETTQSSTSVLGKAVHFGLKAFLGGDDNYPIMTKDTDADRLKYALDATIEYMKSVPDGFIDWKANCENRAKLEELALKAVAGYVREWDRGHIKETIIVEKKLSHAIRLKHDGREIELPVPLVCYPDHVYRDSEGHVCIDDHKTVFRYSDPDAVDGSKLIQAAMNYLTIAAETGEAPYKMTYREYKISKNEDGSSQTREYEIVYGEMPIVFDLFLRLYQDITEMLLGKAVFMPNILAMFDRDVALLAYIYRLDEPAVLEKEMKRSHAADVATLMQKKMSRVKSLKRFMEAKATLFTSNINLNYKTMHAHEKIKYKLFEHGIPLDFADKVEGLSVDLYRFRPSMGIKMSTIEKYQKDVEQILGTSGVRILAPIPNTEYIGFEVPKKKRRFIGLDSIKKKPSLEISFGVDVFGERHDFSIPEMPHLLVAGTTGSGKSVFTRGFLHEAARLPKHVIQFVLLDPKMVELSEFADDNHTIAYKDSPAEILIELENARAEMETRYATFKKHKVRSLAQYREKVGTDIPYRLIVIDEFGDLIIQGDVTASKIKARMIQLAQKARAAGIHLVITTQRPSAKIVDGLIKANFPTRVALRTASRTESEIILDRGGAEFLLGKGDMLVQSAGQVIHLQGYDV